MKKLMYILSFIGLMVGGVALATEKEADDCLRQKIWNGYSEGWAVRTATTTELAQDEHRVYLLTLYAGNEYKVQVCADGSKKNDIDLVLHDVDGKEIKRDQSNNLEPELVFKPVETQTFYVAVYAADIEKDKSWVALAVTYR